MEPLGKIEAIMQELVNDSKFYGEVYPLIYKYCMSKGSHEYGHFRTNLSQYSPVVKGLAIAERDFLSELLFDYYYDSIFIDQGDMFRDLLHNIRPKSHRSINTMTGAGIAAAQPQPTKEKEEIKMSSIDNKKAVQTVTYVYGNDSSEMKDTDFYAVIRGLEKDIKDLEGIENKPKKLIATIVEKQEAIKSIVALMDSKE